MITNNYLIKCYKHGFIKNEVVNLQKFKLMSINSYNCFTIFNIGASNTTKNSLGTCN